MSIIKDKLEVFETIDGLTMKSPIKLIADPSFNRTFKKIFIPNNIVNGISGEDRIMCLINSFLFPGVDDYGYKVKKITNILNNDEDIDQPLGVNSLKFEIVCRCHCWKGDINENNDIYTIDTFDIILQMIHIYTTENTLMNYACLMKNNNISSNYEFEDKIPLKVLSFLVYKKTTRFDSPFIFESMCSHLLLYNPNKHTINFNNTIDLYVIYLPEELEKIFNNKPIVIHNNKLDNTGKEWIKLLTLRLWASAFSRKVDNSCKFIIPKDTTDSDIVIQSIFDILENIDFDFVKKCLEDEEMIYRSLCEEINQI